MKVHRLLMGFAATGIILLGITMTAHAQEQSQEQSQASPQAQEMSVSAEEFRDRLVDWALASEQANPSGENLAVKIASLSDEQIESWINLIDDPEEFLASTERVVDRLQNQRASGRGAPDVEEPVAFSPVPALTTPFPPDYPPGSGPYKDTIIDAIDLFNISGASSTNRCSNADWGDYIGVWWPLNKTFDTLDGACVVSGCDITGISCFIACGILETAKVGLKIAAIPLEACDIHQGAIDGAEIEAMYENTLGLVGDVSHVHDDLAAHDTKLTTHDTNIDGDLIAHNTNLNAHDANIDADLIAHDANIDADLIAHDANIDADLIAHDANIDADLIQHDTDIKALLGDVQDTLDNKIELRKVHMQVLQVVERKRYLVSTKEAGVAVAVEFLSIEVFNERTGAFQDVTTATVDEVEPGLYDLNLNVSTREPDRVFRLRVRHVEDVVDHFGEILFHREAEESSN